MSFVVFCSSPCPLNSWIGGIHHRHGTGDILICQYKGQDDDDDLGRVLTDSLIRSRILCQDTREEEVEQLKQHGTQFREM